MDIAQLANPHILALAPYSSARDDFSGQADIWLDANENAYGTSVLDHDFSRYPDPHHRDLRAELARQLGVAPQRVFTSNGSDEVIDLLLRVFCYAGQHEVLAIAPSYGMYQVAANIHHLGFRTVSLGPAFELLPDAVQAAVTPRTRVIFLCSPNNPSGNLLDIDAIQQVLAGFPGLVVVDEAYIEFAAHGTALPLLAEYPNLLISRTFSKAWGLAGLRLGYALGHPQVVDLLERVKPPYNLSVYTLEQGLLALAQRGRMEETVEWLNDARETLRLDLLELPVVETVFPSDANFLLVRFRENAREIYTHLLHAGVVVRDRSSLPGCTNCLRITVGVPEENQVILEVLSQLTP